MKTQKRQDYTILNKGNLDELREEAERFVNWIFS